MRNLKLIIRREFLSRVRNRTFVIMTFLSPLILVGMVMLIAYLTSLNQDELRVVGIHDDSGIFIDEFFDTEQVHYEDFSLLSLEEAKGLVKEKEYFGLLHIPSGDSLLRREVRFLAPEAPSFDFLGTIEKKIEDKLTKRELEAQGLDLATIESAEQQVHLRIENFSGERSSKISVYVKMFFGGAAGYLLMMFIIIYGNTVMRSVIEEKTNRIVEIIISSVKPMHLMLGKILGTSLAGILQFSIWVILGSVMLIIVGSITGMDFFAVQGAEQQVAQQVADEELQQLILDIAKLPLLSLCIYFLVYFIGGYFLYSSIYAAIGAAVDNETDTQQFMFPVIVPLMLAIYVGFFAVMENPHGVVSTIFSMIPLTSPIVMLMRIPFGVAWWEIAISLSLLLLSILGTVWMAAKIYRIGILMYGKKPSYKELWGWMRY